VTATVTAAAVADGAASGISLTGCDRLTDVDNNAKKPVATSNRPAAVYNGAE